jgi:nitrite reductase (NADH) large subunit
MARYVIVGGGVAGTTAAQNLHRLDPSADVTLLGDEPYPYYYRPKLWEFLAAQVEQSALFYRPAEWYAAQGINLHLNAKVIGLQPKEHTIALATGESFPYDRLLLATGSCCFVPEIPGAALPGVFVLRTLLDALTLRAHACRSRRAVVVGGGLLGLETAHALSTLPLEVTVVEIAPYLLPRQLDREGAQFLQVRLESMGLEFITGAQTTAVLGESSAAGIRLADGRIIPGELILFSAGTLPRIDQARDAGLAVHKGIVVNASMQSNQEDIFAAGDVAEIDGRTYGLVPPAIEQARIASQNMTGGEPIRYPGTLPSATLKLMDMDLTSLGEATADDESVVVRRFIDEQAGIYKKAVFRDGVLIGAILLNDTASIQPLRQLMASRKNVSQVQDRLLDREFDWKKFISDTAVESRPDS